MQKIIIIMMCSAALALSACSVHKLDIQQGNVITPDMRAQIKPGMSKRQINFVLGSPMLIDPFHRDRWDYVYSLSKGHKAPEVQRITLFFDGDTLARIEDKTLPSGTPLSAPETPTENEAKPVH